jgi:hypothetical protein
MKPSLLRFLLVPLLLLAALAALLWLADAVERGSAPPPSAGPLLSPPPDEYDRSLRVSLRPGDPQAQVVFAVGGAVPTLTVGTLYTHPLLLLDARFPGVTAIRAREVAGGVVGPLVSGSYVLGVEHTLPILSVIADPRGPVGRAARHPRPTLAARAGVGASGAPHPHPVGRDGRLERPRRPAG